MDEDMSELQALIAEHMARYRQMRRSEDGRLRDSPERQALRQTIDDLSGELQFLERTRVSLNATIGDNVVPTRSHRLPNNIPRFKRPSSDAHVSVHDYIAAFERKLKADSYPDTKFVSALAACCEPEEADWVEANLSTTLSWEEAKDLFLRHFIDDDMESLYAFELEGIQKGTKETLHSFADRYLQAMRLAKDDSSLPNVRVTHFLTRLPESVRCDLNLVKVTKPGDVSSVAAIVRTLVALYPPNQPTVKSLTALTSKWCSVHQTKSHSNAECTAQTPRPLPREGPSSPTAKTTSAVWCEFHKSNKHSSTECRAQRPVDKAVSETAPKPAFISHPQPHPFAAQVRCHRCGERGHYANRCPTSSASDSSSSQPFRHATASERPTDQSTMEDESNEQSVQDYLDVFHQHPTNHTAALQTTSPSIDYKTAFFVPININGNPATAYIDSGASHSSIPKSMMNNCPDGTFSPPMPNSKTSLGAKGVFVPRLGSFKTSFTWGANEFTHEFEISDPPDGVQVIIGRDLFEKLGIVIGGLPLPGHVNQVPFASNPSMVPDSLVQGAETVPNSLSSHPSLLEAIERNQATSLSAFCNIPEAVVRLDTGDHPAIYRRQYPIPDSLQEATDAQMQEWITAGKVTDAPVGCQYNNPLLVVPKKDLSGNWTKVRICIDPRALNKQLQPDKYPLPLVKDVFTFFAKCSIFSVIDLEQAYLQLPILPEHRQKTAFTWRNRHMMFVGTPFGICNTASVLQRTMSVLFKNSNCTYPFQDDIPLGAKEPQQHLIDLVTTLDTLTAANLRIRRDKCAFFQDRLHLLGHTLSGNGLAVDERKIASVVEWPLPTTGKQIEKYLGLVNYFRDFIPNYSTVAAPLECLRKQVTLPQAAWTKEQTQSFNALKQILSRAPFLTFPNFDKEFCVATDASDSGLGCVLYQLKQPGLPDNVSNRDWVMFAARALSPSEKNYSATKKELAGIVFSLAKFHYYLWGRHFRLYTDHRALSFIFTQHNLNPMILNWLDQLLSYSFTIFHRPGIQNILPDALSRVFPPRPTNQLVNELIGSNHHGSNTADDLPVVPASERHAAIEQAHLKGHFGVKATLKSLISSGKVWPGMRQQVSEQLQTCPACRRWTIAQVGFHPLTPIMANNPMDAVAVDTAHSFPTSPQGNNVLLIVVCIFTRFVFLRALPNNSAISVASALFRIFIDFGFPRIIQSDNGTEFVNTIIRHLTTSFGIDHRLSTPYHPRANGLAERTVQTACRAIRKLLEGENTSWDLHHLSVQMFINNKIASFHSSVGMSNCAPHVKWPKATGGACGQG